MLRPRARTGREERRRTQVGECRPRLHRSFLCGSLFGAARGGERLPGPLRRVGIGRLKTWHRLRRERLSVVATRLLRKDFGHRGRRRRNPPLGAPRRRRLRGGHDCLRLTSDVRAGRFPVGTRGKCWQTYTNPKPSHGDTPCMPSEVGTKAVRAEGDPKVPKKKTETRDFTATVRTRGQPLAIPNQASDRVLPNASLQPLPTHRSLRNACSQPLPSDRSLQNTCWRLLSSDRSLRNTCCRPFSSD